MADLTKNINVGVDASGVKTGLQDATKSIKDFGKTVQSESSKSKTGIDGLDDSLSGLGPTTEKSTKTSERAFSSWSAQVKRAAVEIQAAGDKVKEFELKAQLKGFSADTYKPQLDSLRQVIAEQEKLRASNINVGMSASQMANNLRMVPAQLTDIVVSLQAGQAPMTVLLQQGGQLKDMFGGVGAAAKALGGYVLYLVNPFSLIAAGVAAIAVAYNQGSKENEAFVKAVTLTGNASGVTTSQLREYARQMDSVSGTQSKAAASLAEFVSAGVEGGEQLKRFAQTAIDWEKATGQAVGETAKQFAELQKDPLKAVLKLNEGTNFLTASVYDQIKALNDQGKTAEAAQVAMVALDSSMRERSKTIQESLGYLERGWNAIKGAAKGAWDAMLNVGRPASIEDKLGSVRKELSSLLEQQSWGETGGGAATGRVTADTKKRVQERIDALRAEEWQLEANSTAESMNAAAKAESAKATAAAVAFGESYDKYMSKSLQLKRELAVEEQKYQDRLKDASLSAADRNRIEKEYQVIVSGVKDKYKESSGGAKSTQAFENEVAAIRARINAENELIARIKDRGVQAQAVSEADKLVAKLQEQIAATTDSRTRAAKELALAEAKKFAEVQNTRIELERQTKAQDEAGVSYRKYIDSIYKSADAIGDMADKQDAANASFGKSKAAIAEMAMEQAKLAALNAKDMGPWSPEQIAALQKLASEHERYVESLKKGAYIEASRKYEDQYKTAQAEYELQKYSMSLLGEEEVKRNALLAIRKSELALEIEIDKIKRQSYSNDPTVDEQRKAELIAQVRLNAETNLQGELARIQDQYINQQVQKYDQIFSQGFADMLNNGRNGWKSFTKSLTTTFKTQVADQIYKMFARPIVVQIVAAMTGFMGGGFGSTAAQVASGGGNMMGMAGNASSMWNAISGGLNASASLGKSMLNAEWFKNLGNEALQEMLGQFGAGMMNTASWSAASQAWSAGGAQMAGLVAGSLMNGFAGYGISRMLSGGYSAGGWVNTAAGIASMIPGIGPIAGVVGGIINRAFGRKLKDAGIEGEFGGETGFEGRQFEFYKGGWFRSDKTKYKDLEESTRAGFADQFTVLKGSVEAMGESLGLGSDLLTDFTYKMKLSLKGLSEEDAAKKIQEEFDKIANSMGDVVLTTKDYNKEGETQIEALTRLSTRLVSANEWFKAVGDTLYTVGLAGADMASDLIDAFGGADKFVAVTSNYYDKFFTDQEKVANQTRLLNEQLKKLGVETMPASREEFRKYINSIDVTTEAGQKLYASLLQMADVFDLIYSSAENIAGLKKDLNVQLMRAKGDDEGATRLERDKQLRELEKYKDPELVRLQVEVWAAEDKSKKDAEAKQAADDMAEKLAAAQKAAQDLALKNLEAAISREKEYWNQFSADAKDALSKASSYWTLVTDAAKNLRGSTEDISSWNAAQGMVFIEQAVANARKGLGLSDYDATKSAIDASTAGMTIDKYATQAELDYDKKVLAGQLDELGDFAGLAKSDAQKQIDLATDQIKRLDDTLKFWQDYGKEQVNATLSVTEAVNALYKLLDPKEQERIRKEEAEKAGLTGGSKPPTYTGGGSLGGTVTGSSSGSSINGYDKDGRALYSDGSIGARPGEYDKSGVSKNASLSEEQWERLKSGQSVYDGYWLGGKQYGLESYYWDEQKQAWLKKGSFAVGTNFVPYDMTANIHQGERIIPAADNRALIAAVQGGGNSLQLAEVVAELRSVKEELQAIKASASISAEQNRKATDVLNQVTDGGNGMRSITMNKVLTVRTT